MEGAAAIGGVAVREGASPDADIALRVGPGAGTRGWRVYGEGFCGAISRDAIYSRGSSTLPFGPYIAACLVVGEIFRMVRMPPASYRPTERLSFSLWDYSTGQGDLHQLGSALGDVEVDFGLAGVGAVGCAVIHALWACPGVRGRVIAADPDPEGVDESNLNRCVIFGQADLGHAKASTAARVCSTDDLRLKPIDDRYRRELVPWMPRILVSAVDTNRSRDSLQQGFWPGRLLAASTKDLRAEVLRAGPPGDGPCLRCYNPPEADLPDDLRRERLRAMSVPELAALATERDVPVEQLQRWAEEGGCGEVAAAVLARIKSADVTPGMFAVGFVSALAGTMLAAEIVKEHLGQSDLLNDSFQTAKFQFLQPLAHANGRASAVRRDPNCPACTPGGAAVKVWRGRFDSWTTRAH